MVYLKMLMVGFFENLRSERAIAARCEDSLSVRAFLGYGLEERTPDHSSLSVIRERLGPEIYQGVFEVVLSALKAGMPTLPGVKRKVWPPRCAKPFTAPRAPSRASLARHFCASAECTWNAASSTFLTRADCVEPPSKEQKISLSGIKSRRPALTSAC